MYPLVEKNIKAYIRTAMSRIALFCTNFIKVKYLRSRWLKTNLQITIVLTAWQLKYEESNQRPWIDDWWFAKKKIKQTTTTTTTWGNHEASCLYDPFPGMFISSGLKNAVENILDLGKLKMKFPADAIKRIYNLSRQSPAPLESNCRPRTKKSDSL